MSERVADSVAESVGDVAAQRLAVVIPYYQSRPGILLKAVRSILAQGGAGADHIIVVDDASPVPARDELAALPAAHGARIRIVEQANAGPAAARNRGLAEVPEGTEYVAFLDSDDEWTEDHVERARAALGQGHDFYFADHFQLNQSVSAFQRAGRITPAQHPALAGGAQLHAYAGDMFDQILMGNIIGTSTVVYRYARFPTLRFREQFVYAGEDYLFWLELCTLTRRIAFSARCECRYGAGVNIFSGSGWGTEKSLLRLHHEIKYQKALPRLFKLSEPHRAANRRTVSGLRRSFVADLLHRLRHRKAIAPALLGQQWRVDPQTFLYSIPLALGIVLKR